MKIRKFRAGDMVESASDSEEDKAKTAGLAASNAEKKSSGFLGLGRLFQGNIDEKGSEAYNKYGAGYGREVEAKNDQLKAATQKATAAPAPAASAPAASAPAPVRIHKTAAANAAASAARAAAMVKEAADRADKNDTADMKRNQGSAAPTKRFTKVVGGMPTSSNTADMKRNQGSAAAKPPAPAAPAAAAANTRTGATYKDMEKANARPAANPMSKDPSQRAPAPAGARASTEQKKEDSYADDTSLSFAERRKLLAERMKRRSNADREEQSKSVTERLKETFKAKGGAIRGYASGGSVSSRADGIAQRGKTRGKMC